MATRTDTGPRTPVDTVNPAPVRAPNAQSVNAATSPSTQAAAPAAAQVPAPTTPTAQQQSDTTQQQSASQQIASFLAGIPGLSTLDPTGQLAAWMNGQVSTLAGQGIDASTITSTIEDTMNNPNNDPAAQAVFDQIMPGYNEKIANGTTNSNGSYTGIAGYLQYANQIQAYAQTAGLTNGVVSAQEIGNLWAGDVSASEVSDRITSAYVAATNTPPAVQDYLQSTFGMNTGDIASYYLNPTNTMANLNAVNTGIAGVETGFGSLSKSQAASLSAFIAGPSTNGLNAVSSEQANQALTGTLGNGITGSAASLASGGYTGATAGATVSQDQLLGAVENNQPALAAVTQAQQARTASGKGGGGATTTANGAVGLGFAQQ